MKAYDFTGRAKEEHRNLPLEQMLTDLEAGNLTLDREAKTNWMSRLSHTEGIYKLMGWAYDFRPVLTKYVVKTDYYLQEVWAFDKTSARQAFDGLGRVQYVVEVPK